MIPQADSDGDRVQCEQALTESPVEEMPTTAPMPETAPEAEIPRASGFALSALELAERNAVEVPETVQEGPRTLAEAHSRLIALNAAPPGPDKTARKAHAVLLDRARRDWHRLAQSPAPPPLDYSAFLKGQREPAPAAVARIQALYSDKKSR